MLENYARLRPELPAGEKETYGRQSLNELRVPEGVQGFPRGRKAFGGCHLGVVKEDQDDGGD
jgi:hypothetical protein